MGKSIWLWVSFAHSRGSKKKVKVPFDSDNKDYEAAFESLIESCTKLLSKHITTNEAPELKLGYVDENELKDGDYDVVDLDEPDDFEGMLEEFDDGKGCRILIKTEGLENI